MSDAGLKLPPVLSSVSRGPDGAICLLGLLRCFSGVAVGGDLGAVVLGRSAALTPDAEARRLTQCL
jgi:hypothetical protein